MTPLFEIPEFDLVAVEPINLNTLEFSLEKTGVMLVVRFGDVEARDDVALALLPDDAKRRILDIKEPARRRQSLYARLLLAVLSHRTGVGLTESPPYGPRAHFEEAHQTYVSIAHTKLYAVAAMAPQPIGVDAEFCRLVRDPEGLCRYAFPKEIADYTLEQLAGENDFPEILPFYALWGMREARVKLNAPYGDYRLTLTRALSGYTVPVVEDGQTGELLYPRFYVVGHGHWGGLCQGFEHPNAANPPEENPTVVTAVTNAPLIHGETTPEALLEYFRRQCPKAWRRASTAAELEVAENPDAPEWKTLNTLEVEWPLDVARR